jgi:hypothetical protein
MGDGALVDTMVNVLQSKIDLSIINRKGFIMIFSARKILYSRNEGKELQINFETAQRLDRRR